MTTAYEFGPKLPFVEEGAIFGISELQRDSSSFLGSHSQVFRCGVFKLDAWVASMVFVDGYEMVFMDFESQTEF